MARITRAARDETRRKLLETAAAEFSRRGLDGANINAISVAAGLAKGTVYNYFPSKEALFLAVVEEGLRLAVARAEPLPEAASTRDRLRALLASDIEWARAHEPFARVFVRETLSADPRFYEQILRAAAPFVARVEQVLAEGAERGEIRNDVPAEQLALVFVGLGDLALVQHWGSGGAWPKLGDIPEFVVGLFLDGAAREPARKAAT